MGLTREVSHRYVDYVLYLRNTTLSVRQYMTDLE